MSHEFFYLKKRKSNDVKRSIHLYFSPNELSIFKQYFKIELIYLTGTNKVQLITKLNIYLKIINSQPKIYFLLKLKTHKLFWRKTV